MMSFGLTNAPAYLMDVMNKVIMEYLDKFIVVFINDILVCTKDEENMKNISVWYCRSFKTIGLYAKLSKRKFWMNQMFLLSHVISEEGMFVDSRKIRDMLSWNGPLESSLVEVSLD
jgi:hypothetical protein